MPGDILRLTILARKRDGEIVPPRTKKNHPQIVPGLKHAKLVPSEAYREWERAASSSMQREGLAVKMPDGRIIWRAGAIHWPVNCRALVYREKNIGDTNGFYQAVADFLELVGVLENDRFIAAWDGSRLLKDPVCPRVEVELTPFDELTPLLDGI
jgi:hypothetical protein